MTPAFRTSDGTLIPAVSAAEMREIDRVAVDIGIGVRWMMEHAGRTLAETAAEFARECGCDRVTVLAGDGGNGGGGLCAARHLLNRGCEVDVVLDRPVSELSGATADHWKVLDAMGVDPTDTPEHPGVVIDALVGYGLSGALRGRAADLVGRLDAPVLALDVPSGVDATTGEQPGPAVDPDRTLTLALPKTGLADGGDLLLADIGIPRTVYERVGIEGPVRPFGEAWRIPLEKG